MKNTKIKWADHTFNPWIGCAKVSPGCENCYAEDLMDRRFHRVKWGQDGTRSRTSEGNWNDVMRWNKTPWSECQDCGWRGPERDATEFFVKCPECGSADVEATRQRVFCASLCDLFEDRPELEKWREEVFEMIVKTGKNLDWLVLTKRPENFAKMLPERWSFGDTSNTGMRITMPCGWFPQNLWLGVSVENQEAADARIPFLVNMPARVLFLSLEPLLGPVDLTGRTAGDIWIDPDLAMDDPLWAEQVEEFGWFIDWVIVGGESGGKARIMNIEWVRKVRDLCKRAGVPLFFKQWGRWKHISQIDGGIYDPVGNRHSGNELDGKIHEQFPEVTK